MDERYTEAFSELMESARRLNHAKMPCQIIGISPKDQVKIDNRYSIRCFRSIHKIPCIGYVVVETRKKLRPEYANCDRTELKELREQGTEITSTTETPVFCYPGDTCIDVVQREELIRRSRILFLELTFLDDRVSAESARKHGHVHIDDVIKNEELFADNTHVVFMHFSSRYKPQELRSILAEKLPASLLPKTYVLPNNNIFSSSSKGIDLSELAVQQHATIP